MSDEHHDDLAAVGAAADRWAAAGERPLLRTAADRWLGHVLATLLGGLALAALGGLTGVVELNVPAVVLGLLALGGSLAAMHRLHEQAARREAADAAAREAAQTAARRELTAALDGAIAHVDRLDAERRQLNQKVAKLERRLSSRERKLARVQAFDAERRALEPPPPEPLAGQLTFDAVSE
jgi:predicted lipid-binding transport protein (Tim44 family)